MAIKVVQSLDFCPNCNTNTLHMRQTKQMSWLMHLVLAIFTGGIWLVFWLFIVIWHALTKPIGGKKTCSKCGFEHS